MAGFLGISVAGYGFTLSQLYVGAGSVMLDANGNSYAITSGSATLTFSPNGAPGVGSVTGTFALTSSLATLTGTISGSCLTSSFN